MFQYIFSSILLGLLILISDYVFADKVFILKQKSDDVHNSVVKGFRDVVSGVQIFELDADGSVDRAKSMISEVLKKDRNFYLFAVGVIPTYAANELLAERRNNPVIFTLVFSPERLGRLPKNFCGVLMRPDPKEAIEQFKNNFKEKELIVPYSDSSESAAEELSREGKNSGVNVSIRKIRTDLEAIEFLQNHQKVPLWLLPDTLLVNPDTVPLILNISSQVPVIVFSRWLVKLGASFGYEIDFYEIGRKSGEIFNRIMKKEIDIRKDKLFYPKVKYIKKGEE
ncbi:MAG: hypothetical protein NZ927_07430 [Candidatus Calescibacterium sp.]|nr:hypothetical protein [Candidatus Calescibacterium sp.]MCX7734490.1 hypothetical protein [bacterium]MDW8087316.1 hypothetical protein [Candidatus Calescibacterium sp.]